MADRFNLTAQLQLQAPTNTRQVVTQIRNQLQGINVQVNVQANARAITQVNAGLQTTTRQASNAARSVGILNRNLSEAARRFGVITLATGTMISFAQAVKKSVGEAIAFERELVKLSQVTGKSVQQLGGLSQEVTRLATSLGTSSISLLETATVLAQAGFSAEETRGALDILAKTTLAPSFDKITDTVEGAIAVLRQFESEALSAGGNIKFLEASLDSINAVSKAFAVESSDLISVIRRTGGVFASAGGSVNELIALFTSVRATTRESAETIATGLRTIFTRIQRTETVSQLEQLGIQLRDARGQFVGAFEAVKRLSTGLSSLDPRDYRFSEIVEQLGGFRQIGKVIPLIQQFTVAQDALNVAQASSGSVAEDALTAQQSLANQATKVREEFAALIRTLADSKTFRSIASGALELARAFIRIAEALEPLLPLITSFLALKVGQGLAPGLGALIGIGGRGRKYGGVIHKFARGGFVPGSGNRDTVPAMLQPGEFVIRKSSAEKLGASTLTAMNENKFQAGTPGGVRQSLAASRTTDNVGEAITKSKGQKDSALIGTLRKAESLGDKDTYGVAFLREPGISQAFDGKNESSEILNLVKNSPAYKILSQTKSFKTDANKIATAYSKKNKYQVQASSLNSGVSESLEDALYGGVLNAINSGVNVLEQQLSITGDVNTAAALKRANIDQTVGNLFESVLNFAGAPYAGRDGEAVNAPFDFPRGLGTIAPKFGNLIPSIETDAKSTYNASNLRSIITKVNNRNLFEAEKELEPLLSEYAAKLGPDSGEGKKIAETASKIKSRQSRFFGGKIAKFAAGGIAKQERGILPRPSAINDIIKSGGGYVDIDRTLLRTVGDKAYGAAKTEEEKQAALQKYFLDPVARLKDIKSAGLTQFGKQLQASVKSGQVQGSRIKILSKSTEVAGVRQYLSSLFGIPAGNMTFTSGASKVPFMRGRGPLVDDIPSNARFATGGSVGQDTVPALLTPGEFVINKKSAQSIGYGNLNKMNQTGVSKFNTGGAVGVQKFATGGQAPSVYAGTTTFNVDYDLVQKAIAGSVKSYKALEEAQKKQVAEAYKLIKAQNPLIPSAQAYQQAAAQITQQWGTFYKDLQASVNQTRTFSQQIQKTFPALSKLASGVAGAVSSRASAAVGGREGLQAGAQRLDQIAGAAQQFAFLAGSAAALAGQFSGLDETTSRAISSTSAYVASLVGVGGTVVQLFTSMATSGGTQVASQLNNTQSNLTNAAAQQQCAGATTQNAAAQSAAAKKGSGLGTALGITAIAVVAISAAFKYFADKARAEADQLKKAADEQLVAIEKGTGSIKLFADTLVQSTEKASKSRAFDAGASGALKSGAAGAAIGAAVGSVVPVIGTALGAAIGGIGSALIGGFLSYNSELKAQEDIARRFGSVLESAAIGLGTLVQAQAQFASTLSDIDAADLKPEDRVSRRLVAQADVAGVNQSEFSDAQSALSKALFEVAKQTGKPIRELTDTDFSRFPALAAIIETSRNTIAKANDGFAKNVAESRKTLAEAAKIELTGNVSLDQILKDPTNQLTQSLQAAQAAIAAETQARIVSLQQARLNASTDAERAALTKQIADEQARGVQRQKDQVDALKAQSDAAIKNKQALEQSIRAQQAYARSLERISNFTNAIVAANEGLNRFEAQLESAAAIAENTAQDFTTQAPAGLSDLTQVGNRKDFNRQVNALGASLGPVGQELADKVTSVSEAIEQGRKKLLTQKFTSKIDPQQLLRDIGLDPSQFTGDQMKEINKQLEEAIVDGFITEEEFNKIFGPIIAEGEKSADALKQANELQNRQITLYGKYLDQLQAQRDKEIAARQKLVDVQAKGAELRARARGQTVPIGISEGFRQARAQAALEGVTTPAGQQVRAGDVGQVAATKKAAEEERKKIAAIKNSTQWETLSAAQKKKLIDRDAQLINAIDKTTKELDRLTDQSELAGEMMSQIETERAKRETLTGIITDFVVGGNEQRQAINNAFAGIQNAVSTGTLQGQSEEQRRATVDMLDKLSDITIPGAGGLTGKQVKQELVFRDAIQMGLDPQVARSLATATSKEEQLINALDRLTKTMEQAAGANVAQGPLPAFPHTGGYIAQSGALYRNKGGSIFKPKGTDTVPAMLTPGEFVIRKSAVNKIGAGNLAALNDGSASVVGHSKGGVVYRQMGGPIGPAAIDPANAIFAGQAQNISILSGNQYKALLKSIVQKIGVGEFIKLIPKEQDKKDITTLVRSGRFNINRLKLGDSTAQVLDTIISQQNMFESIGGAGFRLKRPGNQESIQDYAFKLQNIVDSISRAEQSNLQLDFNLLNKGGYGNFVSMIAQTRETLNPIIAQLKGQIKNNPDAKFGEVVGAGDIAAGDVQFAQAGIAGGRGGVGAGVIPQPIQDAIDRLRNNGLYFNNGGSVQDTVPAMLTPGEFVMSKEAVQRHGLNNMRKLNQGVTGFNSGGLVGNVQYKQGGGLMGAAAGMLGIDPSRLQGVLDGFLSNFSKGFDNIIQQFTGMQTALENLTKSFSGFTMEHTVNVEGMISIGGLNLETVKQELSTSIGQMVAKEVTTQLDNQSKGFRAG